jgi:hypothetical protein
MRGFLWAAIAAIGVGAGCGGKVVLDGAGTGGQGTGGGGAGGSSGSGPANACLMQTCNDALANGVMPCGGEALMDFLALTNCLCGQNGDSCPSECGGFCAETGAMDTTCGGCAMTSCSNELTDCFTN